MSSLWSRQFRPGSAKTGFVKGIIPPIFVREKGRRREVWRNAQMKNLLIVKAAVEVLAGLFLAFFPTLVASVLLGSPFTISPVATVIARIGGSALVACGIACWLARNDTTSRATYGLIAALLFYDAAAVATFLFARFGSGLGGLALWLAVTLHSALGISSVLCLSRKSSVVLSRGQS